MRPKLGDIFTIPVDETRYGYGQVVGFSGILPYFAVFAGVHSGPPNPPPLNASEIVLIGLSMDALLHHGTWQIVGNRVVDESQVPLPAWREVWDLGRNRIIDYTGTQWIRGKRRIRARLETETTISPMRFQLAFRALAGVETWQPHFDSLKPVPFELTSQAIFGSGPKKKGRLTRDFDD